MSVRSDVLLWAQRVLARKTAPPHQILEIPQDAGLEAAQEAFHRIARLAHPDLHRSALTAEELELVTAAYARAAAAYQEVRMQRMPTARIRAIRSDAPAVAPTTVIPTSPPSNKAVAVTAAADDAPASPAQTMTSKALIYYRKAELCLRRGELTTAVLQLKMAIASDPQSAFLRSALSEVEGELAKKP